MQKKVYKWWKRSIKGFSPFSLIYLTLTSILHGLINLNLLLKNAEKSAWFFCSRCNDKIWLFCSPELYYITLLSLQLVLSWVFISYNVHRNKQIDTFINNTNGVIIKNLSLFFFFRSALNEQGRRNKNSGVDQKSTLFYFFVFVLKIQDIRNPEPPIFERG